jgi:ArsR family transcriptional regulator
MKNIKFLKEPGYIYDLLFLFVLNFNKEYCLANFINYNKSIDDTDYLNKVLLDFDVISDDLLPFFFLKDNSKCFMTEYYYEPYKEEFTTSYNLLTVQTNISNHGKVIANLIQYYFPDLSETTIAEWKDSITFVGDMIKKSKYSDSLKSSLYSFFINPSPVIQKLSYELMAKEFLLSKQYEKNYIKIAELQHQIDIDNLSNNMKMWSNQKCDIDSFDDIYISICLINKNCIKIYLYKNQNILILGTDYIDYSDYLLNEDKLPELDVFGNALSEKNRIEILDLILKKDEITIKDIEQELGFTGTNAYYHLSLMINAKIIKSRNQGRTILYSINKHHIELVCGVLKKYINKSERKKN